MKMQIVIAIGNNEQFAIVTGDDVENINIKYSNELVNINREYYPLYIGVKPMDITKINNLLKSGRFHVYTKAKATGNKTYDFTVCRFGCIHVIAPNEEAAIKIANSMKEKEISWNDDWNITDIYEIEE